MSETQLLGVLSGAIHLPLALTVWLLLRRDSAGAPLVLWVVGAAAMGLGLMVSAAGTAWLPMAQNYMLATGLTLASVLLRIGALRLDLGRPAHAHLAAAGWLLLMLGYAVVVTQASVETAVIVGNALIAVWTLVFAWHARLAGRQLRSRSGSWMAWVEGLFGLAISIRVVAILLGWAQIGRASIANSWDQQMLVVTILAAALYGNLGYLGMALDRSSSAARRALAAQLATAAQRELAESTADELRHLLDQRDQLARERARLLQLLAHEIRQPLHNASGALQAATTVLQPAGQAHAAPSRSTRPQPRLTHSAAADNAVAQHLLQAQAMLAGMQSVLDNTLGAATLLARDAPLVLQDTDIDFVVALALGDLSLAQRQRVQLQWSTSFRSAELEPGLVRLALRNLLLNAFAHGGPAVQVLLDVAETQQPPALLLRVQDNGAGLPDATLQRLSAASHSSLPPAMPALHSGSAGPSAGHGLGLFIVRRVMQLHGGHLTLAAGQQSSQQAGQNTGQHRGLVACLVLPQPLDDEATTTTG